jgi:aldehyde:ferredoxin oxidoreductase
MADVPQDFFSIWRINLRQRSFRREPVPQSWEVLGGRALLARIMLDEVVPNCDPLGPHNKLIYAPGLLVGHMLSSCDRISIGAKSPLTGGIKEANAGGRTGLQLAQLGVKALILEDRPADDFGWCSLHLSSDGVRFEPADDLVGMGVFDTTAPLLERYGDQVAISLIGPGGERLMSAAGIQNLDKDRSPSRMAARGGLGAVMGSKKIKAIVIDGPTGDTPPLADPEGFQQAKRDYTKAVLSHHQTKVYHDYGTAAMTSMCNSFGALPTRNFSQGQFEAAEKLSGEFMRERMLERGKRCDPSHACMAGCIIQSSNVYGDPQGQPIVSPLEYETIGLMGANLAIEDLDSVARLNQEVNDLGLDSIEIGGSLGVAVEAGLMEFGDGQRALELVQEIRQGTPLGRVLGQGSAVVGKVFGVERIPVVKNQTISAYDPRAIKGTGVTYATSPQGADHTSGLTIRAKVDHLNPKGQADLSRSAQVKMAAYDSLGACIFASFGISLNPEVIPDLLTARYGWELDPDFFPALGKHCLAMERDFNRQAGFTAADDRLPEWMTREPLPPHQTVFDVPDEDLDGVFNWEQP